MQIEAATSELMRQHVAYKQVRERIARAAYRPEVVKSYTAGIRSFLKEEYRSWRLSPDPDGNLAKKLDAARVLTSAKFMQCIVAYVAENEKVSYEDIMSDRRTANIVWPRHISIYITLALTGFSLPRVGRFFNGRDHTTILSARRKIDRHLAINPDLRAKIERYMEALRPLAPKNLSASVNKSEPELTARWQVFTQISPSGFGSSSPPAIR